MNISTVFKQYVPIKIDKNFVKTVLTYKQNFINSSESNILFLGSNLIGVNSFKFLEEDRLTWIEDILNIDDIDSLRNDIHNLEGINKEFFVSSDITNLSFVWIAYQALSSNTLTNDEKHKLATASIDMLQYKFLSSIHTRFFPFPANEGLAKATYEALDKKSGLKRYGTWIGLLDARTADILSSSSIHHNTLRKFNDDEDVVKMLNDIQGRIKAIMKKLTDTFNRLRAMDAKIQSTNKFTSVDGELLLKEHSSKYEKIRDNLHTAIPNRNDFIQDALVEAILKTVKTVSHHHLEETLKYVSDNYGSKESEVLKTLVNDVVIYAFELIRAEKINMDHIPTVMIKLMNMFRSSRVTDPVLISIRNRAGEVVENALNTTSSSIIVSTRIGLILYIVLRGLMER